MNRVSIFAVSAAIVCIAGTGQAAGIGHVDISVAAANPQEGVQFNHLSRDLARRLVVTGSDPLENPSGLIRYFGFLDDGAITPAQIGAGAKPASRTEADKNTYLTLARNPGGPIAGYDYGRHFLFQGHEIGGDMGYITRINLDVDDPSHRITLLTPVEPDGKTHLSEFDGSTWNPFTRTLLFTQEDGGATLQLPLTWPPRLTSFEGILGTSGYEGIQLDGDGNLYLAEDIGGTSVNVIPGDASSPKAARQPNSFLYRFLPYDKTDLMKGGKLQALRVSIDGTPITFHENDPSGDVFSEAQLLLHTQHTSWPTDWVTVNDTGRLDPDAPQPSAFDANALAKAAGATPFKRPENHQFQPGRSFTRLFFDETGDTNADSGNVPDLAARGAWGSVFQLDLKKNLISIFVLGDAEHAAFDNLAFADATTLLAEEDRGDGLHTQLNMLDSMWGFSVIGEPAVRWLALGRDPVSLVTGDNEPTGIHISNGSTATGCLLGQTCNLRDARGFFTQQHGMNRVWEIFSR